MVVGRSEDKGRAQRGVQPGPKGTRKAGVAVRDEHVGEPNVTEDGSDEITRCNVGGGGLDRRYQPHAACQEVDVHLQEVVTRAGRGQFEKVKADAAAPACRHRKREAGADQVVGGGPL